MKRVKIFLLPLILFIGLFLNAVEVQSQSETDQLIPMDPAIKTGKLDNGITYYIWKNKKPEERIELRLALKAGSILENEDQQGLAHFVEHMAFNGTKHFEKQELIDFLELSGVNFGAHLNAYTSFDETVYMIQIPAEKDLLDKGILILSDWANGVTFEGEEIDKERGVVVEEWRLGRGADARMRDKYFPTLLNNSRYAERLPIGKKEVLENFNHDVLKKFYKDWYRPELMSIIVVGDFEDEAEIETKIKEHFEAIPKSPEPVKRKYYEVPDHQETYVAIETDKEASRASVSLYYKHDKVPTAKNLEDLKEYYKRSLYNGMLNSRLRELLQQPEPPFAYGYSYYSNFVFTKDAYISAASAGEKGLLPALEALLVENERVLQHGFTQSELDREMKDMIKRTERAYNERDKSPSRQLASACVSHFLKGDHNYLSSNEFDLEQVKKILPTIELDEINQLAKKWITDENRVVVITAPEKEDMEIPSEEEVLKLLEEVGKKEVEPYVDNMANAKLLSKTLSPVKIVAERKIENIGVTELELENGVKVVLKPTDFKNDEIQFTSHSPGGHSLYTDEDYLSAANATSIMNMSGIGDFDMTQLNKLMAGKTVRVNPFISELNEGIRGMSSKDDLETMLQLTYLYFTAPRKDEDAFKGFISRTKAMQENYALNPDYFFYDTLNNILSQNSPRRKFLLEEEEIERINLDKAMKIYKDRFADASDFTFVFVGNFEVEEMKPLLAKYLGSLPSNGRKEDYKNLGINPPGGEVKHVIHKGIEPKSNVRILFHGPAESEVRNRLTMLKLGDILSIKLRETLREDKGGVYGVGARGSISNDPEERFSFNISFGCAPENVDELIDAALGEIKKIEENGPETVDMEKVTNKFVKNRETQLKENGSWLNLLNSYYSREEDPKGILEVADVYASITAEEIKAAAKKYFNQNYVQVVLKPEVQ